MKLPPAGSPLCALVTAAALGLAPISCKDEKPADGGGDGDAKAAPADAKAGDGDTKDAADGGEGNVEDKKKPGGIAKAALEAAGVVPGAGDIEPRYPKDIDALLDLVPQGAESFMIIRDVGSLVDATLAYSGSAMPTYESIADEIAKEDPGDAADMRTGLEHIKKLSKTLADSGIDLSAGVVIANDGPGGEKATIIYGSATADALPTMLVALGATGELPDTCKVIAEASGYAACSQTSVASYAPGSRAAELRKTLASDLPGVDLERANVLAHIKADDGTLPFALETGQGMAHLAFAVPQARAELSRVMESGKAPGLGLIGPGQPFLWGRVSASQIATAKSTSPAPAHALIDSVTGEFVLGGLDGIPGIGGFLGVTDPAPASGMVALASMGLGEIPKSLPDGTKIDAKVETVGGTSALHVAFSGGKQEKIVKDLGYVSELFGFAAGNYMAFTAGADDKIVDHVAKYAGTEPTPTMLAALPPPLSKSLEAGDAVLAMYMPFDAMQSAAAAGALEMLVDEVPAGSTGKTDPKAGMKLALDAMAALSSASVWVTHLDDGPIFHVAVQGVADVSTPEGKEALAAVEAVAGGADREATYRALADKYPSSPRAPSYKARAGDLGDPFGSMVVLGALIGGAGAFWFLGRAMGMSAASSPPTAIAPAPASP